ncbi:MAG: DUF4836 family protein [Ignavibacteriales bacterium]|nr:DUF4836 family protein [Ignavibacteriales bacterium]
MRARARKNQNAKTLVAVQALVVTAAVWALTGCAGADERATWSSETKTIETLKSIPADADYAMFLNWRSLAERLDDEARTTLRLDERIAEEADVPETRLLRVLLGDEDVGLDPDARVVAAFDEFEDETFIRLTAGVNDADRFEEFVASFEDAGEIEEENGERVATIDGEPALRWNPGLARLSVPVENAAVEARYQELVERERSANRTLADDPRARRLALGESDLSAWITLPPDAVAGLYDLYGEPIEQEAFDPNERIAMALDFEKGVARFSFDYFFSERLRARADFFSDSLDPTMIRYLPPEENYIVFGVSLNIPFVSTMPSVRDMAQKDFPLPVGALLESLEGDALVSMHGFTDELMPRVLMGFKLADEQAIDNILAVMAFEGMESVGDHYVLDIDEDFSIFIARKDDLLYVSTTAADVEALDENYAAPLGERRRYLTELARSPHFAFVDAKGIHESTSASTVSFLDLKEIFGFLEPFDYFASSGSMERVVVEIGYQRKETDGFVATLDAMFSLEEL